MQQELGLYGPLVISVLFHVHRVAGLELLPSAGMIELVLCAVIALARFWQTRPVEGEREGQGQGEREREGEGDGAGASPQAATADQPNEHLVRASWALPLTNVLTAIIFDHLAASKSRGRQRGGKKRSRRSRSKSRRRRRSKKH